MLDKIEYELNDALFDEEDVLTSFVEYSNWQYEGCINDVINSLADDLVPIHYDDIWKDAQHIKEWINQGLEDGLSHGMDDIDKIIQVGYYVYYRETVFNNLGALIQNIIIQTVNNVYLDKLNEEDVEQIDLDLLAEKVEEFSETIDSGNYMKDIRMGAESIIQNLKDGVFNQLNYN